MFGVARHKLDIIIHKKLDARTISGCFIGYPKKSKWFRFIALTILRGL